MASKSHIIIAVVLVVVAAGVGSFLLLSDDSPLVGKYQIQYDRNGGSVQIEDPLSYKSGSVANILFTPTPLRNDYTFLGWDQSPTASEPMYTEDGITTITIDGSDVTLYAIWKQKAHAVTYLANGGSSSVSDHNVYYRGDTVNVLFSPTPTREGYNFLGWGKTSSSTEPDYYEGGCTTFTMSTSNVLLYAVWEAAQYTLSYDANGGSGEVPNPVQCKYGSTPTVDFYKTPTKEGKSFRGWSIDRQAVIPAFDEYSDVKSIKVTSDVVLYAIYGPTRLSEITSSLSLNYAFDGYAMVIDGSGTHYCRATGSQTVMYKSVSEDSVQIISSGTLTVYDEVTFEEYYVQDLSDTKTVNRAALKEPGKYLKIEEFNVPGLGVKKVRDYDCSADGLSVIQKIDYYEDIPYYEEWTFSQFRYVPIVQKICVSFSD